MQNRFRITAAAMGKLPIGCLLGSNIDINAAGFYGETLLMVCIFQQDWKKFSKLLKRKGINLDAQDSKGNTALHHLAERGFDVHAQELLKAGANPNVANNEQETPVHTAAKNNQFKMFDVLKEFDADMNARTKYNWTPYAYASAAKYAESMNCLEKMGANTSVDGIMGYSIKSVLIQDSKVFSRFVQYKRMSQGYCLGA